MAITFVGNSGRTYIQREVLRQDNKDHRLSILKVESEIETFVSKRVSSPFYKTSQRLAEEFAGSRRLRIYTDYNQEESILIYPYFRETLLALIQRDLDFPTAERKKILRCIGEAIQELHNKDWIHIDVKPDNILVNLFQDSEGNKIVTDAVLGDFDIAFKSEDGKPRETPYAIGNAMWRSPEGQTGRVTKASDVFSYGLVCIFTLGGGELLVINDYQELAKNGIRAEQEIVTRHFCYFGPVPKGLLEQVSKDWHPAFNESSRTAERAVMEQPEIRFSYWGKELGLDVQNMISGMTNLDPMARLTANQILANPWWQDNTL